MSLVLLLFAGALWRTPEPVRRAVWRFTEGAVGIDGVLVSIVWWILMPLVVYALLRLLGKILGSHIASWGSSIRRDLYRGLLGHGDATVAMAISFRLVYDGLYVEIAYTVIILSVVLHDLIAPRMLRALLVDAGELRSEQGEKA
jgi:NhaP-type Na+/H+ or K+/H+ antiporter